MAHKRNPVASVSVLACAHRVPPLVATMLSAMPQEHERAAGRWQAEWPTLLVLLGNSLGTDTTLWDRVVAELRDRWRIVRFDHRGQGSSPVPHGPYDIADLGEDVVALLDELEIDVAAVCGVSLGGMVGLWLAAHAPERVERLVACCTSAYPASAQAWAERGATVLAAGSTEPIADAVVARWVTPAFAQERPDVMGELRAMLL